MNSSSSLSPPPPQTVQTVCEQTVPPVTTSLRFLSAVTLRQTSHPPNITLATKTLAGLMEGIAVREGEEGVEYAAVACEYGRCLYWGWFVEEEGRKYGTVCDKGEGTEGEGSGIETRGDGSEEEWNEAVRGMGVRDLKAAVTDRGGSTAGMTDKSELIEAALALRRFPTAAEGGSGGREEDLEVAELAMERAWAIYSRVTGAEEGGTEAAAAVTTTTTTTTTTSTSRSSSSSSSSAADTGSSATTATTAPPPLPPQYLSFATSQIPRVLSALGDLHMLTSSHASAAAAFIHALPHREASAGSSRGSPVERLARLRLLADTALSAGDALLASGAFDTDLRVPDGAVLVPAGELLDFSQGYFEKAKRVLEEAVLVYGKLAGRMGESEEVKKEKEDLAHSATLIVDLGQRIEAERDREREGREK